MRFMLPERKRRVLEMTMPVRWGDMDAMGHVNNTVYFRYLEIIRIEWFRSIGCEPNPRGQGPVIVNAFCSFLRQIEYPAELRVTMYVSDPGRTTFETWATIERTDQPGTRYAEGGATVIWVDFPSRRAIDLPDGVRALVA